MLNLPDLTLPINGKCHKAKMSFHVFDGRKCQLGELSEGEIA